MHNFKKMLEMSRKNSEGLLDSQEHPGAGQEK